MTEAIRFATGFKKVQTDEPGLELGDDGKVYLVSPGGGRAALAGSVGLLLPKPSDGPAALWAFGLVTESSSNYLLPDADWLYPFAVDTPVTVTAIAFLLSIGEDGKHVRLALYEADSEGQPGALVIDAGEVAIDKSLESTIVLAPAPVVLPPGFYVVACNYDGDVTTAYPQTLSSGDGAIMVARAYGAFPDPYPTPWSAADVVTVLGNPPDPADINGGLQTPALLALS